MLLRRIRLAGGGEIGGMGGMGGFQTLEAKVLFFSCSYLPTTSMF